MVAYKMFLPLKRDIVMERIRELGIYATTYPAVNEKGNECTLVIAQHGDDNWIIQNFKKLAKGVKNAYLIFYVKYKNLKDTKDRKGVVKANAVCLGVFENAEVPGELAFYKYEQNGKWYIYSQAPCGTLETFNEWHDLIIELYELNGYGECCIKILNQKVLKL